MKYLNTLVTFREIPDEISLCINITNCPIKCPDCHSKELWEDIGKELSQDSLEELISKNPGISCVCFMGGDSDSKQILQLAKVVKKHNIKVGWYSGRKYFPNVSSDLDYVKIGPYIKKRGGLDNPDTNQKLFKREESVEETSGRVNSEWIDITNKFWKNEKV